MSESKKKLDCILIDDDPLVHLGWEMLAKQKNKHLRVFSSPEEFFEVSQGLDLNIPIYVDSNLGNGIKGEEISKKICALGFRIVYLATAFPPEHFGPLPWLKGIVGKYPPWK